MPQNNLGTWELGNLGTWEHLSLSHLQNKIEILMKGIPN